jgi:hypothetical protein
MPRRAKFAIAAEEWLRKNAVEKAITTKEFWEGLSKAYPDLTTASEARKTPKATCMRDLRKDGAFEVGGGTIALRKR